MGASVSLSHNCLSKGKRPFPEKHRQAEFGINHPDTTTGRLGHLKKQPLFRLLVGIMQNDGSSALQCAFECDPAIPGSSPSTCGRCINQRNIVAKTSFRTKFGDTDLARVERSDRNPQQASWLVGEGHFFSPGSRTLEGTDDTLVFQENRSTTAWPELQYGERQGRAAGLQEFHQGGES